MAGSHGKKHIILSLDSTSAINNNDFVASDRLSLQYNGETFDLAKGVTDITYAELTSAISNQTLSPGSLYKITDFQSISYIQFTDSVGDGTGLDEIIQTGPTEPLIVLATSNNTLSSNANSVTYPSDIIIYDWRYGTNMPDRQRDTVDGQSKGAIIYRKDVYYDISCDYDFRGIKFRRWNDGSGVYKIVKKIDAPDANDYLDFTTFPLDMEPARYTMCLNSIVSLLAESVLASVAYSVTVPYELANFVVKPGVYFIQNQLLAFGDTIENTTTGNRAIFANTMAVIYNDFNIDLTLSGQIDIAGNLGTYVKNQITGAVAANDVIYARNNIISGEFSGNRGKGTVKNNTALTIIGNTGFVNLNNNVLTNGSIQRNIVNELYSNTCTGTGDISDNIARKISGNTVVTGITVNDSDEIYNNSLHSIHDNSITSVHGNTTGAAASLYSNSGDLFYNNTILNDSYENVFSSIYNNTVSNLYQNRCSVIRDNVCTNVIDNSINIISDNTCSVSHNVGNSIQNNTGGYEIDENNVHLINNNVVPLNGIKRNVGFKITNNTNIEITDNHVHQIHGNSNSSAINYNSGVTLSNNTTSGSITYNNVKSIDGNSNSGGINENSGTTINGNSGTGAINGNNVTSIINNEVGSGILYNTGYTIQLNDNTVTVISNNQVNEITGNSGFSSITNNSGQIFKNITGTGGGLIIDNCQGLNAIGPLSVSSDIRSHCFLHPVYANITVSTDMSNANDYTISAYNDQDSKFYALRFNGSGTNKTLESQTQIIP